MKKLIIDKGIFYQRIAILDNDTVEFLDYKTSQGISVGDIYLAKVKSLNNSNKSSFLELEEGQDGYLSDHIAPTKQGEMILVEVTKEAFEGKLPSVSTDISIAGKNIVLLPNGNGLRYSRKLKEIESNKTLISKIENSITKGGAILRSGANLENVEEIITELNMLKKEYESFELTKKISTKPKLMKKAKQVYEELFDTKREALEIIVNDKNLFKSLGKSKLITPKDQLILKETSLFSIYGIGEEKILEKTYEEDKAQLIIEKTEAMTVIDINSKGKEMDFHRETNILKINLSLCKKLVQLIIIKNISGIIIVDFISMKQKENKQALINKLKEEFKIDKTPVKIMEITSLGLVQIVRQRQGKTLLEKLSQKCNHCQGRGYEPSADLIKIRLEEKIKLEGYETATQNMNIFVETFTKEEMEILEKTYKTPTLSDFS